jgi:hypothetical protein
VEPPDCASLKTLSLARCWPAIRVKLVLCGLLFLSSAMRSQNQPLTGNSDERFALAAVSGRTLTVFPTGSSPRRKQLDFEYLLASAGSDGKSIVGWGFRTSPGSSPSRRSASLVVSSDFGDRNSIIEGFTSPAAAAASPDGRLFATIATNSASHTRGLLVMEVAGGSQTLNATLVQTDDPSLDKYVAWSPDSKSVLFALGDQIQTVDVTSRQKHVLLVGTTPSLSPNGRFVAYFKGPSGFFIADIVAHTSISVSSLHRITSRAAWMPDSSGFVVAQDWGVQGRDKDCYANSRLVEYSVAGVAGAPLLNPCSLKPELFFLVDDWPLWLTH